jgi:hypothetical protein
VPRFGGRHRPPSLSQQKKRINKRETKMNNMPRRHPQSYRGSLISESKLPKRDDVAMGVLDTIHVDKSSNDEHHPIIPFLCNFGTIDISKFILPHQ